MGVTQLIVPPGGTLALLVQPVVGECASILKYFSGGSAEIFQAPSGNYLFGGATNWAAASLAALPGTGYLMSALETLNLAGAARYYIAATGATAVLHHIHCLSTGF